MQHLTEQSQAYGVLLLKQQRQLRWLLPKCSTKNCRAAEPQTHTPFQVQFAIVLGPGLST